MRIVAAALTALWLLTGQALAQGQPVSPTNQAAKARAVTPSDTVNLPDGTALGIFIGNPVACNIAMILEKDSAAVTWSNVQSGSVLPARAKRVMSANTNCSGIVALY